MTLAIGYGGREEIADAVRAFLADCATRGLSTDEAAASVIPARSGGISTSPTCRIQT